MSANIVQQQVIDCYQKNIIYFEKNHKVLYKKLILLDIAIQEGKYQEKYSLEYRENSYFDVFDLQTKQFLYGEDSKNLAKKIANNVNFDKTNSVIETFYPYSFTDEAADEYNKMKVTKSQFTAVAPIINYTNKFATRDKPMLKIYKYMFFGVGLGLHIKEIDKKIRSKVYFIVENDLELFKLSLFTINYEELSKKSQIIFSVMEDESSFTKSFEAFYYSGFIYNHYLKFNLFSQGHQQKFKYVQNKILSLSHLLYTYEKRLKKNEKILERIMGENNFLNISKKYPENIFSKKPVLLVAAGPSLTKNIEWFQQNHKNFIVVALFMTLKTFYKLGIKPDIIIHIDEGIVPIENVKKQIDSFEFFQESLCIFAASVPDNITELFSKKNCFFIEGQTNYKKSFGNLGAYSVGEFTYALLLIFNASDIFLLGLDLALDQETGSTHSSDHVGAATIKIKSKNSDDIDQVVTLRNNTLSIKGNFRDSVETTPLFNISVQRVNYFTHNLKDRKQNVYNLNDGAYFEGINPIYSSQIDMKNYPVLDKSEIRKLVKIVFINNSSSSLTDDEKAMLKLRYEEAQNKLLLVENYSKKKLASLDNFQSSFVLLSSNLIKKEYSFSELSDILFTYLNMISGYIINLFNTKNIGNTKKHIREINIIFIEQLYKIIYYYIELLEGKK